MSIIDTLLANQDDKTMYIFGLSIRTWSFVIAGPCVFLATIITVAHMITHCLKNRDHQLKLHILRILFMVPIYGLNAILALFFYDSVEYFTLVREAYEAITIYSILQFLYGYLGGEQRLLYLLSLDTMVEDEYYQYRLAQRADHNSDEAIEYRNKMKMRHSNEIYVVQQDELSTTTFQPTESLVASASTQEDIALHYGEDTQHYLERSKQKRGWKRIIPFYQSSSSSSSALTTSNRMPTVSPAGASFETAHPVSNGHNYSHESNQAKNPLSERLLDASSSSSDAVAPSLRSNPHPPETDIIIVQQDANHTTSNPKPIVNTDDLQFLEYHAQRQYIEGDTVHEPEQHNELRLYPHMWPINYCLTPVTGERLIFLCKISILQYVPIQILCAILALMAYLSGAYHPGRWTATNLYPYLSIILNFSQIWAMYGLFHFYYTFEDALRPISALGKVMTIKGVVFFCFWQSVAISLYYTFFPACEHDSHERQCGLHEWDSEQQAAGLNNFLICIEMLAFAIVHVRVFSWKEFAYNVGFATKKPVIRSVVEFFNPEDIYQDVNQNLRLKSVKKVFVSDKTKNGSQYSGGSYNGQPIGSPSMREIMAKHNESMDPKYDNNPENLPTDIDQSHDHHTYPLDGEHHEDLIPTTPPFPPGEHSNHGIQPNTINSELDDENDAHIS